MCSGTSEGEREGARRIKSGRGWWGIHVFETTDGGDDDDHRLAQVPDPGARGVAGAAAAAAGNMGNTPFWSPGRRELREHVCPEPLQWQEES